MPEWTCSTESTDFPPLLSRFLCGPVLFGEAFSCHLFGQQMSILSPSCLKLPHYENVLETSRLQGFYFGVNYLGSASLTFKHYSFKRRVGLFKANLKFRHRLSLSLCVCGGVYVSPMLMQSSTDSHSALVSQRGCFWPFVCLFKAPPALFRTSVQSQISFFFFQFSLTPSW